MSEEKNISKIMSSDDYRALLDKHALKTPQEGELVKGAVISASKAEVKLDIDGVITGVVRGPELYEEDDDYANLKPGDPVEATVIDLENENGELELSFRFAGQEKAWTGLRESYNDKTTIKVKVADANKGGLLVKYRQIAGFLPVSQLASENYPRVNGGDKGKILEKLRSFIGADFETKVMTLDERDDKIIFSEKEAWNEKQKDVISKYKVGTIVEGKITAITDFGVFISFGENLEGLIHISELAWQRIDNPADLYRVGEKIKAEVISLENSKIFLSAKKLMHDPWDEVEKKFKVGEIVEGKILKVNPFGLFVSLDEDIHGLAHISQLNLAPKQRINEKFKGGTLVNFEIVSIEPKDHRLGLSHSDEIDKQKPSKRYKSSDVVVKKDDSKTKDGGGKDDESNPSTKLGTGKSKKEVDTDKKEDDGEKKTVKIDKDDKISKKSNPSTKLGTGKSKKEDKEEKEEVKKVGKKTAKKNEEKKETKKKTEKKK